MGLDWNPLGRPKPGLEREYEQLFRELESGRAPREPGWRARLLGATRSLSERERRERLARFREVSEPPFAVLGAPRVGFDPEADAWLEAKVAQHGQGAALEQARQQMHGFYVLDLLPACDGFPPYTNYGAYEGLDRYSFRAAFLDDVRLVLGDDLHRRAWERMLARDLAAYAEALEGRARAWAAAAGVAHLEHAAQLPAYAEDDPASQAHLLFSAIRWCRYWSARGFGLDPWF